jgi:hypothetical protein
MNTTAWCERSCWNEMSPPFPLSFTKMHYPPSAIDAAPCTPTVIWGVADMRYEANCWNRTLSNSQDLFHTGIKQRLIWR